LNLPIFWSIDGVGTEVDLFFLRLPKNMVICWFKKATAKAKAARKTRASPEVSPELPPEHWPYVDDSLK